MSLLQSDVALLLDAVAEGRENGRLIPVRYEIAGARSPFGRITRYVEQRRHRDGRTQWAVSDGAFVLATDGQWEYEPLPSNRGAAFLARTRYDSPADALAVYDASLPDSSAPAERERL